jgi:hypothetical protein
MAEQLSNGRDKESEAEACDGDLATGVVVLQTQLRAVQIGAARHSERATIEALMQDAMRRYVEARKANNIEKEVQAVREILRLEIYLSRRGFV